MTENFDNQNEDSSRTGMSTPAQKGPVTKRDFSDLRSALRSQVPEVLTEGQVIWFVALSVSNKF